METGLRLRGFGNCKRWCWYSQMIIMGTHTDLDFQCRACNFLPVPESNPVLFLQPGILHESTFSKLKLHYHSPQKKFSLQPLQLSRTYLPKRSIIAFFSAISKMDLEELFEQNDKADRQDPTRPGMSRQRQVPTQKEYRQHLVDRGVI
ncbi:hypothetical protein BJX68DRAFT_120342 [Aspergillus pseudodeflectus]|uniref:Uncharacterized protein n=1 Tax=Aspergillus pseudodeflectus TaxID=176178 RepID=A0ABR4K334_9EURO